MTDFVFVVSFFDLIDAQELVIICDLLDIKIDLNELERNYEMISRGQGDAFLFLSKEKNEFLFLDLFQSPTDQNEMVKVGIRCKNKSQDEVFQYIQSFYKRIFVKSEKVECGIGLLDTDISITYYPRKIPTITNVDGKDVYEYYQKLQIFYTVR